MDVWAGKDAETMALSSPVQFRNAPLSSVSQDMRKCPDCGVLPKESHIPGCDVERCPACGGQIISCGCDEEIMHKFDTLPWTGVWPGSKEAEEFGWFSRLTPGRGWVRCSKDDDGATPDLNRLCIEGLWDQQEGRWKKKEETNTIQLENGSKINVELSVVRNAIQHVETRRNLACDVFIKAVHRWITYPHFNKDACRAAMKSLGELEATLETLRDIEALVLKQEGKSGAGT